MPYLTKVTQEYSNGIGDTLLYYYNLFGDRTFNREIVGVDAFSEMIEFLYEYNKQPKPTYINFERLLPNSIILEEQNKAMVLYSSGVDSTYKALPLKRNGVDVTLLHAKGLNRAYPDETLKAISFSKDKNIPMILLEFKKSGKEARVDNPVKDQMLLGYALDYGIVNNITQYCTGNLHHYHATPKNMEEGMSNVIEMFELFEKGIKTYIPAYRYSQIDETKFNVFKLILEDSPESFANHIASCITPLRFKKFYHDRQEKKFGIKLLENHCGSCYKCVQEYIILQKLGYYPVNVGYIEYCSNFLRTRPQTTSEISILPTDTDELIQEKVLTLL